MCRSKCAAVRSVLPAELAVASIADGDIAEAAVDEQIDQRRAAQDAVGDQIFPEPVEDRADQRADDDDREADFGIEVLADVEVGAAANRTHVDARVAAKRVAERQRQHMTAAAALDRLGRFGGAHGQPRVAFRAMGDDLHQTGTLVESSRYLASTSPTITVKKST